MCAGNFIALSIYYIFIKRKAFRWCSQPQPSQSNKHYVVLQDLSKVGIARCEEDYKFIWIQL